MFSFLVVVFGRCISAYSAGIHFFKAMFSFAKLSEFSRRNIWSFGVLLPVVLVLIVLCTRYLGLIVTIGQHDPIVRSLVTFAMS